MTATNRPKVSIALFAYGGIQPDCLTSHLDLIAGIVKNQLPAKFFSIREDALISRSRCRATGKWLDDPDQTDVLVMIDHDIEFNPRDLWTLAQIAFEHIAIVGVPYAKRSPGMPSACRPALTTIGDNELVLVPMEYIASGFCAFSRSTAQFILDTCRTAPEPFRVHRCSDSIADFWSLWQPFPFQGEYLSEDYAFCERAHHSNVPVLAWTQPLLKHWGSFPFQLSLKTSPLTQENAVDTGVSKGTISQTLSSTK